MKKRLVCVLTGILAVSALAVTGCGEKELTAEEIVKTAQENAEKAESFSGNMDMSISMSMDGASLGMDTDFDMDISVNGALEYIKEPETMHMDMEMSMMGISMEMDTYTKTEDDQVTTYVNTMGTWVKEVTELGDVDEDSFQDMYNMIGDPSQMTLAEETETVNEQEAYVLTTTVTGDQLESLMGQMEELTGEMGDFDLSDLTADVTMKVYKETLLPASVSVEMSTEDGEMEVEGISVALNGMSMTMDYTVYNSVESIEIPEEALNAVSSDEMLTDDSNVLMM